MDNGIRRMQAAPALLNAPNAAGNDAAGNDAAVRANGAAPADEAAMQPGRDRGVFQARHSRLAELGPFIPARIASYLGVDDMVAMASSSDQTFWTEMSSTVTGAITDRVSRVYRLTDFQTTLTTIGNLPPESRAEPLFQLGLRVHALLGNARPQAVTAFRAAVNALPVENRTQDLTELAELAVHATQGAAVLAGVRNVGLVARFHDVNDDELRSFSDWVEANRPAVEAVLGGDDNVAEVARLHGIMGPENLHFLEKTAINGPALEAALHGQNVQEVAIRLGIGEIGANFLEIMAIQGPAGAAVRRGENVQEVAELHGIRSRRAKLQLQAVALLEGAAGAAVRRGENVQEVARRNGIFSRIVINSLEHEAVNGPAGDAVRRGENVQEVALDYGISTPQLVTLMHEIARIR